MEIKTVWAEYFSGTGTTEKVATHLARSLAGQLGAQYKSHDYTQPKGRENALQFGPDELVVLGTPVYAGRVPNMMLPFVQNSIHGEGTLAVPVVLYGNRNFDDGLMELKQVMTANGFLPIAGAAIVGEHSFSKILGAGRPDGEDMALVDQLAQQTAEKVKGLAALPAEPVQVEGCDPIRPYDTPRDRNGEPIKDFLKAKPVTDLDKCVRCGLCARLCPMGAIDPNDVSQVVGKCIKCCACVKKCPMGAKYFDHEGYLYHQHELEDLYAARRAESKIFI